MLEGYAPIFALPDGVLKECEGVCSKCNQSRDAKDLDMFTAGGARATG